MRRVVLTTSLLALLLPGGAQAAGFRMPSGNIACDVYGNFLRCDILSGLRPEPRAACKLDWTGLTVTVTGRAWPTCAGDTVFDPRAPVLRYDRSWRRGGFSCRSRRTGLRCTNRRGRGFFLARERWQIF